MQTLSVERAPEYGGSRFLKALATPEMDFEKAIASRLAKGLETAKILDDTSCDAILIPQGCRNPAEVRESPVVCLPMGFYSSSTSEEVDEHGHKVKEPNIPYANNYPPESESEMGGY
jgi:hypothetical protein